MFYYFAYGSSMNEDNLHKTTPSAHSPRAFELPSYELTFNLYSKVRRGGLANIRRNWDASLWGVLWEVEELESLRKRKKHPFVFEETVVDYRDEQPIYSYVHREGNRLCKPTAAYAKFLLSPAVPLPASYAESMKKFL